MFISDLYLPCPEIEGEKSCCSDNAQKFCSNSSSAQFEKHFLVFSMAITQFLKIGNQAQFQ